MIEVSRCYRDAALYIEENGLARGVLLDHDNSACILGAIGLSHGIEKESMYVEKDPDSVYDVLNESQPVRLLAEYLVQTVGVKRQHNATTTVWQYIDNRTKEYVVRLLNDAAKHYDAL